MKSKLTEVKPKRESRKYPFIGRSDDLWRGTPIVILFQSPSKGMIIHSESMVYSIGQYATDWNMKRFIPLSIGSKIELEVN